MKKICTYENAENAYNLAKAGKRFRPEVLKFEREREVNLLKAVDDLKNITYSPGSYFVFKVWEPKERVIMALPFYDRVIQHMIVNKIRPIFESRMIQQSYACREGKGIHAASAKLAAWLYDLQVVKKKKIYALSGDIHHYFESVDQEILKKEIRRYIGDEKLLKILDDIIEHNGIWSEGKGIPVGNLTSQLFANVYLNILDQYVKHQLKEHYYIRYMDNFIILQEDIGRLREDMKKIADFVSKRLKLQLNEKSCIIAAKNGVDFVGYRHFPGFTIMRKNATRKITKLIRELESGEVGIEEFDKRMESKLGHMQHADTYKLRKNLRKKIKSIKKEMQKNGAGME